MNTTTNTSAEDHESPTWLIVCNSISQTVMGPILIASVVSNIITLIAIWLSRQLHTPTNILLASLVSANLATGVMFIIEDSLDLAARKACNTFATTLLTVVLTEYPLVLSHMHNLLIAIEKYLAIVYPLRYSSLWTNRHVTYIVVATWLTAFIIVSTTLLYDVGEHHATASANISCSAIAEQSNVHELHLLTITLVLYVTQGVIVTLVYVTLLKIAKRHRQQIQPAPQERGTSTTVLKPRGDPKSHTDKHGTKLFWAIVITYCFSWGPYVIVDIVGYAKGYDRDDPGYKFAWSVSLNLGLSNALFSIFVYAWGSKAFRRAYKLAFCCKCKDLRHW